MVLCAIKRSLDWFSDGLGSFGARFKFGLGARRREPTDQIVLGVPIVVSIRLDIGHFHPRRIERIDFEHAQATPLHHRMWLEFLVAVLLNTVVAALMKIVRSVRTVRYFTQLASYSFSILV